jgi:MFS family permease
LPVLRAKQWAEYGELAVVFYLQAMATAMWLVPLSTVFEAHGLHRLIPYAYATTAAAAFVSPLIFGAMADRHASPVQVLRWLAVATAVIMSGVALAIHRGWNPWVVLALIQLQALFATPTGSISTAIVFSRLRNSQTDFGPVRAMATFGWMCGCWAVSLLNADASVRAVYADAVMWLVLAAFTFLLPGIAPPKSAGLLTLRQRMGWDALELLKKHDHRVVFITAALFYIPLSAFYPFTPPQLLEVGLKHTSAWMTLGQTTEIVAMFCLAALLSNWRLKWIFTTGLGFGVARFALCALNGKVWVLAGVTMHGLSLVLFLITAQVYVDQRVDPAWRARAQALFYLMTNGVGNLLGFLGTGWWFAACTHPTGTQWPVFWGGLSATVAAVLIYFLIAYHGKQPGVSRVRNPGLAT